MIALFVFKAIPVNKAILYGLGFVVVGYITQPPATQAVA